MTRWGTVRLPRAIAMATLLLASPTWAETKALSPEQSARLQHLWAQLASGGELYDSKRAVEYSDEIYSRAKSRLETYYADLARDYGGCVVVMSPGPRGALSQCEPGSPLVERARAAFSAVGGTGEISWWLVTDWIGDAVANYLRGLEIALAVNGEFLEGYKQGLYKLAFRSDDFAQAIAEDEASTRRSFDALIEVSAMTALLGQLDRNDPKREELGEKIARHHAKWGGGIGGDWYRGALKNYWSPVVTDASPTFANAGGFGGGPGRPPP